MGRGGTGRGGEEEVSRRGRQGVDEVEEKHRGCEEVDPRGPHHVDLELLEEVELLEGEGEGRNLSVLQIRFRKD